MKKWIIFLSIAGAFLIFVFCAQIISLCRTVTWWNDIKFALQFTNSEIYETYKNSGIISHTVRICLSLLFVFLLLAADIFLLITIAMRKITPLSISENLAAWKEHRAEKKAEHKQRKLEKAQAKVEQLQEEIQKDDN